MGADTKRLAELLHATYEARSVVEGWETQESCRVPFSKLPDANQRVMLEVAEMARRECDPRYRDRMEIEALRDEVERLTKERDDKKDELRIVAFDLGDTTAERDAALARAEKAERERDEARRMYCRERAANGERIYGEGDQCRWNTPRKVCRSKWPDAADALFPVEVKPCG